MKETNQQQSSTTFTNTYTQCDNIGHMWAYTYAMYRHILVYLHSLNIYNKKDF